MDPQKQQFGAQPARPVIRPTTAMPIQRGNYGLPPRPAAPAAPVRPSVQPVITPASGPSLEVSAASTAVAPVEQPSYQPVSAPTPKSGQFMDFAPSKPRVVQPIATTAPELPKLEQPVQPEEAPTVSRPLFTPTTPVAEAPKTKHRSIPKLSVFKTALLGVGILLLLAGAVRFVSAGSTANDTIAVGAVSANDGRVMTIQFTATDGKMHKITADSNPKYIPGTAVEMAYRSGAPEATARQVAVVKSSRDLGGLIAAGGIVSLLAYGALRGAARLEVRRKHKHRAVPLDAVATA